jgi:catechol 2,3-dioxygenase-like lactoylglutathione lyase family enzyme
MQATLFDHIGIKVRNLEASASFYGAVLAELGYVLCSRDETSAGFGPADEPALWLYAASDKAHELVSATHLAFRVPQRTLVDTFHERGLKAGGRDHGKPGVRADYGERYYAAFLLDPDGNNVEAVCTR